MNQLAPIGEIAAMLTARAAELARELLPHGHREGSEWREARSKLGGLGDSLSVNVQRGVWMHGAAGRQGDMLDLVAYLSFNDDKRQAIDFARRWLGLDGRDPDALRKTRRAQERHVETEEQIAEKAEKRRRLAQALWLEAMPIGKSGVVGHYLRYRGINLSLLDFPVKVLRYHDAMNYYPADYRRGDAVDTHPCMVALITGADGKVVAIHRTYLEVRPDLGQVTKAALPDPKRTLGSYRGGAIRLWNGVRIDPETGEVKYGRRIADPITMREAAHNPCEIDLTEGIEDGLTVVLADPTRRVWAGVALANMAAIEWPPHVSAINIHQQNDAADSAAARAFHKVVDNCHRQKKLVRLFRPPADVKDINQYFGAA